jgi:hypothetical protein
VLIKRMLLAIEELFPLEQERGHPRGIIRIDPPREFDEGVALRPRTNPGDFDLRHGELISTAVVPAVQDRNDVAEIEY